MMQDWGYGYGGEYSALGRVFGVLSGCCWLLFLIALVVLVVWLVRRSSSHAGPPQTYVPPQESRRDEACDIARTRYARGEITAEEYREICATLGVPPAGQ